MYVFSSHIAEQSTGCVRVVNRVRLPILLVVSWPGKMNISLSPFAPENLAARDGFVSAVPSGVTRLILHTQAESGPYSRGFLPFPRRRLFIYLKLHTPSGQSRVHRVTRLRTDGTHCRKSAGTGPVNLKVVPVTSSAFAPPWTAPLFLTLTIGMKWAC